MNILLVTIDSLRADRVGTNSGLTPEIDALAEAGIDCRQAVTHGHGTPVAFPSILTGTYPMLHGGCSVLSPRRPILARRLKNAGYDTVAFTSNPHLFDKYGYSVGFDNFNEYQGDTNESTGTHSILERTRLSVSSVFGQESLIYDYLRPIYYFLLAATDERPYAPADEVNEQFFSWLDNRNSSAPFFSWIHYMDTHYPFYQKDDRLAEINADPIPMRTQRRVNRLMNESPEALTHKETETLRTLYDAETRFTDEQLGLLFENLRERDLWEETLVIITSDHGEALGEHGAFGHYKALYEELFRVPLIFRIPSVSSHRIEEQVGLVEIAPTVLDYVGEPINMDHDGSFSGTSLRRLIEGNNDGNDKDSNEWPGHKHVIGHGDPLGVRTERWKYVWWDRNGNKPLEVELFDLHADPKETTDVSDDYPEIVTMFDNYLEAHIAHSEATDHEPDAASYDANSEIESQLEALGYR